MVPFLLLEVQWYFSVRLNTAQNTDSKKMHSICMYMTTSMSLLGKNFVDSSAAKLQFEQKNDFLYKYCTVICHFKISLRNIN